MFFMKKGMWLLGVPFIVSLVAVMKHSAIFFILYILTHFMILKIIPAFKHRENIGMFVTVAFSTIPLNIYLFRIMGSFYHSYLIVSVVRGVVFYAVLLSVEEIVMGVVTRWIWKRQYKSLFDD